MAYGLYIEGEGQIGFAHIRCTLTEAEGRFGKCPSIEGTPGAAECLYYTIYNIKIVGPTWGATRPTPPRPYNSRAGPTIL